MPHLKKNLSSENEFLSDSFFFFFWVPTLALKIKSSYPLSSTQGNLEFGI